MNEIFAKLNLYFQYDFVRFALIVGVFIALSASLLGVVLVLRRFSFIGDGLSHVAFGAVAVSMIFGVTNDLIFVLPITVGAAVLILKAGQSAKIKGDAALAMMSVGALAVGYLLMNVFSKSANLSADVCSTLFGATSILTLSLFDVWLCVILSLVVICIFVYLYNKIFTVTFDENFALASGLNVRFYNLLIAVITAVIIVLAMNLVGSLLTTALIVFPALSAMNLFKSFKGVVVCSAVVSVICAGSGILVSILTSTPVGATIVVIEIVLFIIFYAIGFVVRRG